MELVMTNSAQMRVNTTRSQLRLLASLRVQWREDRMLT